MKRTILSVACLTVAGSVALFGCKAKTAEADATDAAATTETPAAAPAEAAPAAPAAPAEAAATTPAGTFDINAVPVTSANLGTWPYLSRLKGYKIGYDSDSTGFDFDRAYIYDGKKIIAVEGRIVTRNFRPIDSEKAASEIMMQRNYENLVTSLGGVKVASGQVPEETVTAFGEQEYNKHNNHISTYRPVDTYVIRQKDKEVWVQVQPEDDKYQLNVIEKAAMPQQAGVVGATELKKN
ncbi:hypothetical protein [Hymenobacter chitinivorans]|uniref:hypothetical protein n=1 Tax=Hymenobacter chitinivorans TaxID=89969 RepID=UPI0012FE41D1|nr:hypothetical protein [Hymenobacter chitinivorans]